MVAALACCAACSDTGLAGRVTTTTSAEKGTTTAPTTNPTTSEPGAPNTPGSPGPGGSGGGTGANQPDGFVVFQNLETPSTLWSVHADGTAKKQLPAVGGQVLTAPLLSPDGSQLAFEATPVVAEADPSPPPQPKLWVSRSDGTGAHPLTTDPTSDTCAAWSPDGTQLLSSALDPSTGKTVSRLLAVPPLPAEPSGPSGSPGGPATPGSPGSSTTTTTAPPTTPTTTTPPVAPTPVPIDAVGLVCPVFLDANTLVYAVVPSPPSSPTTPTTPTTAPPATTAPAPMPAPAKADTIVSVHLDGSPGETLATIGGCNVTDVRVAPAGGMVAFSATCDDSTANGLYLVGGNKQASVVVPDSSGAFAWSPDAAWLAYSRTDPTNPLATTEILIARSNGSDVRRLIGPANQAPTWGPLPSGGASDRRV